MKIITSLLTILVVVVIAAVVAVHFAGNVILAKSMQEVLGVPVKISKVQIGFKESGIYGLEVSNPEGFDEKKLANVPEIAVKYDLSGLLGGKIHLQQVRLNLDEITIERRDDGGINLMKLAPVEQMTHPDRSPQQEAPQDTVPAEDKQGQKQPMQVQIDEVVLSMGKARYVDTSKEQPTTREFAIDIQNAVLKDVTNPNEVVQQIVLKTMQKVGLNALVPDFDQFSAAFKAQASAKVEEMKQGLGSLAEKMKLPLGGQSS